MMYDIIITETEQTTDLQQDCGSEREVERAINERKVTFIIARHRRRRQVEIINQSSCRTLTVG